MKTPSHFTPDEKEQRELFKIPVEGQKKPFDIGKKIPAYGCNFPYLFSAFFEKHKGAGTDQRTRKRLYIRLYRRVNLLQKNGLVDATKRADGLIFMELTSRGFYLIRGQIFSNPAPDVELEKTEKPRTIYDMPKRARIERQNAIELLQRRLPLMDPAQVEDVTDYFLDYQEETDAKVIVLAMKDDQSRPNPENILTLPYKNRFNDEAMKVHNLKKFDNCWAEATKRYDKAVFLTLTTDPKRFKSNWDANRHFQKAWNRYLSYLTKYLGYRPSYITGFEFTQRGLLHAHAVFFGIDWLSKNEKISKDWSRAGQGEITHIYSIRKEGLTGKWVWGRKKPKDGQRDPASYLKKYLKKSMYGDDESDKIDRKTGKVKIDTFSMYWAINKRFFSYSRIFDTMGPLKRSITGLWLFIGSCYIDQVPLTVQEESKRYKNKLRADAFRGHYSEWGGSGL